MKTPKYCLALSAALAVVLVGCQHTARSIWSDGLKQATGTDQLGSNVLFLGPSNVLGPGTIFDQPASGGLLIEAMPKDIGVTADYIVLGNPMSVDSSNTAALNLSASIDMSKLFNTQADVSAAFKNAKTIKISSKSVAWDDLNVGKFKALIDAMPKTSAPYAAFYGGKPVMTKALRLNGLSADLDFGNNANAGLKAQIPTKIQSSTDPNLSFDATWTNDQHLVISVAADQSVYIAGQLNAWAANGWASGSALTPVGMDLDKSSVMWK